MSPTETDVRAIRREVKRIAFALEALAQHFDPNFSPTSKVKVDTRCDKLAAERKKISDNLPNLPIESQGIVRQRIAFIEAELTRLACPDNPPQEDDVEG